jgi:hypothetical protein
MVPVLQCDVETEELVKNNGNTSAAMRQFRLDCTKRIGIHSENNWMQPSMDTAVRRERQPGQAPIPFRRSCRPRRACRVEEAAAIAVDRNRGGALYFPVNSDDATAIAAADARPGGDASARGACISLLIRKISSPGRPPKRSEHDGAERARVSLLIPGIWLSGQQPNSPGGDFPVRCGLYFPVNSRGGRRKVGARLPDPRSPGRSL